MITVRHEQRVPASPESVWDLLADFDGLARWADSVGHSSYLSARQHGVGTRRRVQAGSLVLVEEITGWEPHARLAYALQGLPPIVSSVVNEWTLEPDGDGCRVALTAHITPGPRPPMRLAARVLGRRLGAANAGLVADLARAMEGTR